MSSPIITFRDKKTGDTHYANEVNEVKTVVNVHSSEIDAINARTTVIEGELESGLESSEINYDNATSGLDSDNVQEAIDELNSLISDNSDSITNLSNNVPTHTHTSASITDFTTAVRNSETVTTLESLTSGNFRYTDEDGNATTLNVVTLLNLAGLSNVNYDNTVSGLTATKLKQAIDELAANPVGSITTTGGTKARNISDKFNETISVLDFNGVYNDYSLDSRAGIQAAEDYCESIASADKRVSLYFPAGTYKITDCINKKSNVNWYGPGTIKRVKADSPLVDFATNGSETRFSLVLAVNKTNFDISGLGFKTLPAAVGQNIPRKGYTVGTPTGTPGDGHWNSCIHLVGCSKFKISDNKFHSYSHGIIYQGCEIGQITNNIMSDGGSMDVRDIISGNYLITGYSPSGCGALVNLHLSTGVPAPSSAIIISGNIIDNSNSETAIESLLNVFGSQPISIQNNFIYGSEIGIQCYRGNFSDTFPTDIKEDRYQFQSQIQGNFIYGTWEQGILVRGGNLVKIDSNILIHTAKIGSTGSGNSMGAIVTRDNPWDRNLESASTKYAARDSVTENALTEISNNYVWNTGNDSEFPDLSWVDGDDPNKKYFYGAGIQGTIQARLPRVRIKSNYIGRDEKLFSSAFTTPVRSAVDNTWSAGQKGIAILIDNTENIIECEVSDNKIFNFVRGIQAVTGTDGNALSEKSIFKNNIFQTVRYPVTIDMKTPEGVDVIGNYMRKFERGIYLKNSPFSRIHNNHFLDSTNKGIELANGNMSSQVVSLLSNNRMSTSQRTIDKNNFIVNNRRGGTVSLRNNEYINVPTPYSVSETVTADSTFSGRCREILGEIIDGVPFIQDTFTNLITGPGTNSPKTYYIGDKITKNTLNGIYENVCVTPGTYGGTLNFTCNTTSGSKIVTNIINQNLHIQSLQGGSYNASIASGYLDGLGPQQFIRINNVLHYIVKIEVDLDNPTNNKIYLRDNATTTGTNLPLTNTLPTFIASATDNVTAKVSTIVNMRALEPTSDGQIIYLNGHTTAGIGGGLFAADFADTTSVDNNGTIIVTPNGRRWKRQLNGFLDSDMFGGDARRLIPTATTRNALVLLNDFNVSSVIVIDKSDLTIDCRGHKFVPTTTTAILQIQGTGVTTTHTVINSGMLKGSNVFTTNLSLTVGQYVHMISDRLFDEPNGGIDDVTGLSRQYGRLGQIFKITQIVSANTYRTDAVSEYNFLTTENSRVAVCGMLRNISIHNARINDENYTNQYSIGISLRHVDGFEIVNPIIYGSKERYAGNIEGRSAIKLSHCLNGVVKNALMFHSGWYGIEVIGACRNIIIYGGYAHDCRHAVSVNWLEGAYGEPIDTRFLDVIGDYCEKSCIDEHDRGIRTKFVRCIGRYSRTDSGFQQRCNGTEYIDCESYGNFLHGFAGRTITVKGRLTNCKAYDNLDSGINYVDAGADCFNCETNNNGNAGRMLSSGNCIGGESLGNVYSFRITYNANDPKPLIIENVDASRLIPNKSNTFFIESVNLYNPERIFLRSNKFYLTDAQNTPIIVTPAGNNDGDFPLTDGMNKTFLPSATTNQRGIIQASDWVNGVVTVSTPNIRRYISTSSTPLSILDKVRLTVRTATNAGNYRVSVTNKASFTVTSSNTSDTSVIEWEITGF